MADMRYSKLDTDSVGEDDSEYTTTKTDVSFLRRRAKILNSLWFTSTVAFFLGIIMTFLAFRLSQRDQISGKRDSDFLRPPGDVKVQFQYDDTYPGPPTMESEYAWLDLLPDGVGAVQHDDLSDAIVTFAVFHQIHCLMAIRHALYDDWNVTRHSHMTPHHSRHCLEYLRQSIMCNADTNLEYRVVRENGIKETPGWDVKRCRDYDATKKWAQEWRAFDGKIPSEKQEITDPAVLRGRIINY